MFLERRKYEVHIVGYGRTNLSNAPRPFFINRVDVATQGFSSIATVETDSLDQAYSAFVEAERWCRREVKIQPEFGVHVKLEECRESTKVNIPCEHSLLLIPQPRTIQSTIVSAWDVHLDGQFTPKTREELFNRGYIRLDYVDAQGIPYTTMTLHFVRQETCVCEFNHISREIGRTGGFSGTVYWEDPLAFVVVGETLPRPIVL